MKGYPDLIIAQIFRTRFLMHESLFAIDIPSGRYSRVQARLQEIYSSASCVSSTIGSLHDSLFEIDIPFGKYSRVQARLQEINCCAP